MGRAGLFLLARAEQCRWGSAGGGWVAHESPAYCMNVVAPQLSLQSHRSWQAWAEFPAAVMNQPWHSPSVASLTYMVSWAVTVGTHQSAIVRATRARFLGRATSWDAVFAFTRT